MSEVVYLSRVRIERDRGPYRRAFLPAEEDPIEFGVHSEIAAYYGVEPEKDIATTLDYVVAATGG
jgi:hypothetical protein